MPCKDVFEKKKNTDSQCEDIGIGSQLDVTVYWHWHIKRKC